MDLDFSPRYEEVAESADDSFPVLGFPDVSTSNPLITQPLVTGQSLTSQSAAEASPVSYTSASNSNDQFICDICQKQCVSRENLRNHRRHVHPKKSYPCPECQKIFKSASSLRRHASIHATSPRPNVVRPETVQLLHCSHCSRSFKSQSAMNAHKNRVHCGCNDTPGTNNLNKDFLAMDQEGAICRSLPVFPGCFDDFQLDQPVDLSQRRHTEGIISSTATAKRPSVIPLFNGAVACGECGKVFQSKSLLSYHRRNVHPPVLHACHECGKSFKSKSHLRRHGRVHSGERPFPCGICSRRYSDSRHVREHQAKFHGILTGLPTSLLSAKVNGSHVQQNFCDNRPGDAGQNLGMSTRKQHLSSESDDGQFYCFDCRQECSTPMDLRRHLIRRHISCRLQTLKRNGSCLVKSCHHRCPLCSRFAFRPPVTLGWHLRHHASK